MEQKLNQKIIQLQNEIVKLKNEKNKEISKLIDEKYKETTQMNEEIIGLKNKNIKFKEENSELKEKMAKIEAYMKKKKFAIPHLGLPAKLLSELFGSLPVQNALGILVKMPNGLLARNVQKTINDIKEAMKKNKWNPDDCGKHLIISEDGLVAKRSSIDEVVENSVRATFPILHSICMPKIHQLHSIMKCKFSTKLSFYNEIVIGFCCQKFSLENRWLETEENSNSIKFLGKGRIFIDGNEIIFKHYGDHFKEGDIVGIGLINQLNSKIEYFATCNGKLLGKVELPDKFATIQLFPAVTLYLADESIRANFGSEEWCFNEFGRVLA